MSSSPNVNTPVVSVEPVEKHTVQDIPSNLYKPTAPLAAKVVEHRRVTDPNSPNEVTHIVLDIANSDMRYLDGQSIGVLPPGADANGKPHKLRLYSIASPHYGDDGHGKTVTVCVKRAVTEGFPPGVCSSFLCDSKVGDTVNITGPVGKSFLLPNLANANVIMVATGTGIAPFRAFLKTRFEKRTAEKGQFWLFFGAQTRQDYLYQEDLERLQKEQSAFKLVTAFSREEKNAEGGRMYVQHRIQEQADTLFELLQDPKTYLFICGLRGMESGIMDAFAQAAQARGINWETFLADIKSQHRWHVEVY